MSVVLAAAPGWGLAKASSEAAPVGPLVRLLGPSDFAGRVELADDLWTGPIYAVDGGDDDGEDGAGDDYHAFEECILGGGISLTAGGEGQDLNHVGDVEHEAVGIFRRCYGGQGTRAAPTPPTYP